jgi:tagaturonate reductase
VLERFANPYIKHLLLSITLNSVSKFKTRVLPSITGFINKQGKLPRNLTFSLAALIAFYNGANLNNGELSGIRHGEIYPIKDDVPVLERFASLYKDADLSNPNTAKRIAHAVLSSIDWWGEDLSAIAGFEDAAAGELASIWEKGIGNCLA